MPTPPAEIFLSRPLLRQLAVEGAYAEGERMVGNGQVRQPQFGADRITARVADTRVYRAKIWKSRGQLHFACSCPAGRDGAFCPHCAAVGLTWVLSAERAATDDPANPAAENNARTREKLGGHLQGLDRDRLVNLLLEATDYDDILRRRLLMETTGVAGMRAGDPRPDFAAYRQILHDAIDAPDYVDYDAMPDYVHGVAEAIQPLGELLRAGYAATVLDLVELALVQLDRASDMIDASDGSLNAVYDDLQGLHLEASRAARLPPEELAARLLHHELEGGLGVFNNAAKTYADVLGPAGLAAWRKLLNEEWSRLTARSPGAATPIDHRGFQVRALMEALAVAEGNSEALAAIKQHDLSGPHDFLSLADWHQRAGRADEAISWAERGLRVFPDARANADLRGFLVEAYLRTDRHAEALRLLWTEFAPSPTLEGYLQLRQQAGRSPDGWPAWRERALAAAREHLALQQARHREHGWTDVPDHTLVVEFLLADGADDAAWAEAETGGASDELWRRLAEHRERTHPADALRVYQRQLAPTIARGGPRAYKEAIDLLTRISALLEELGRASEYDALRAEVRATHRQKRTFVKLLDASGQ